MTDHPLHYVSEYDILDRIAARHGLDFTVDENLGRVDERDEYRSRSSRDATDAELQMWRLLVPEELRRVCDNIWVQHGDGKKVMALPATPEEVYSNTLYHEITYVSAEDAAALLGLPCFEPNLDRQTLLDGLIGSVHGKWKVYVSRQVPQGYYHDRGKGGGRAEVLHPVRAEGERRVVKVDPDEFMQNKVHFEPLVQRTFDLSEMRKVAPRKTG
jgi:hypothetical protein